MTGRKNAGYTIIQSLNIGNAEFVLGYSPSASSPYVTWECKNGTNYFGGHYFTEKIHAQKDLLKRAETELSFVDVKERKKDKGRER